jgi:polysaccharide export outer membrane protein
MRTTTSRLAFVLFAAAVAPGLSSAVAQEAKATAAPAANVTNANGSLDYVIGPQDVLAITVFDSPDLSAKYTVELDGTFSFPLVGRVTAGGQTMRQFEATLRQKLADGYFKNPQITVSVEQYRSQRVFVIGEVRAPGPYPLTGDMTLIEALAKAGSTTPSASDEVVIVRGGDKGPVLPGQANAGDVQRINLKDLQSGAVKTNLDLRDGDTIYVSRAELVYVFGQVKNPASYAVKSDTTVLQALSLAGGVTPNGAMSRIKVVRIVDGEKKEIKVKLTDLVKPGDTIIVPERYF